MAYQAIFKRYEVKYMLTIQQKAAILAAMEPYMELDKYGRTTIRNLYFDTPDYLLVRHSIEKPVYKEKLRIRSYQRAEDDSPVFVELKKKYRSVVYKRRLVMPEKDAMDWMQRKGHPSQTQISEEIEYFFQLYRTLRPAVFLSYEREAYFSKDGTDFRVTFDDTILCRQENLTLQSEAYGTPILPDGKVLMEVKCSGGIPLWMVETLSKEHIYKMSFSKYGTAYRQMIFPHFYDDLSNEEVLLHV